MPLALLRCLLLVLLTVSFAFAQEPIPDPPMDADEYREWTAQYHTQFPALLKAVEKDLKNNAASAPLLYQKGVLQLAVGDYAKALMTFLAYSNFNPQDDRAVFQMARCHQFAYQYREALTLYKKYSELHPQDPTPWLAIVNILSAANDKPQAVGVSEQLARAFPQSVAAQANLAETYNRVERRPEAIAVYEAIIRKWPTAVEVQRDLVSLYLSEKQIEAAASLATQATQQSPQAAAAWEAMGNVYQHQNKLTEAYQAYEKALQLRPASTSRIAPLYTIGHNAILTRNYSLAIRCYEQLVQVDATDADALFRLGRLFALTGKKKDAEDVQKRLKKLDKELANQLSKEISKPDKIEQEFVNTCANSPTDPAASRSLRPSILYKEKAHYTDLARSNRVQGVVVLSLVFTADARISALRVVRGLPDGLNEEAMKAARKIRFRPACKNGQPVSVRMSVEFTFNLL